MYCVSPHPKLAFLDENQPGIVHFYLTHAYPFNQSGSNDNTNKPAPARARLVDGSQCYYQNTKMGSAASGGHESKPMEKMQAIWTVVNNIPEGSVLTYGKVAEHAGLSGYSRYVGYALKHLSSGSVIPWHRVLNSRGMISFPPGSERYAEQKLRLTREGVIFIRNRINLKQYLWRP